MVSKDRGADLHHPAPVLQVTQRPRLIRDAAPPAVVEGLPRCVCRGEVVRHHLEEDAESARRVRSKSRPVEGGLQKHRRSNWYSNSYAFDRMLRESSKVHFENCRRLRHLPPVPRRTIRRKERRMMEREAQFRFEKFRDGMFL